LAGKIKITLMPNTRTVLTCILRANLSSSVTLSLNTVFDLVMQN